MVFISLRKNPFLVPHLWLTLNSETFTDSILPMNNVPLLRIKVCIRENTLLEQPPPPTPSLPLQRWRSLMMVVGAQWYRTCKMCKCAEGGGGGVGSWLANDAGAAAPFPSRSFKCKCFSPSPLSEPLPHLLPHLTWKRDRVFALLNLWNLHTQRHIRTSFYGVFFFIFMFAFMPFCLSWSCKKFSLNVCYTGMTHWLGVISDRVRNLRFSNKQTWNIWSMGTRMVVL